jgi:hypothetical protein
MIWSVLFALVASALLISPVVILHRMPLFQTVACLLFGMVIGIYGAATKSVRGRITSIIVYGIGITLLPIAGRGYGPVTIAGGFAGSFIVIVHLLIHSGRDDEK